MRRLLVRFYGLQLRDISLGEIMAEVFGTAQQYHIDIPADLALMARTLIILDGVARRLDPDFDMVGAVRPYAEDLVKDRFRPRRLAVEALDLAEQSRVLVRNLPRRADVLLDRLEREDLQFRLDVQYLERMSQRISQAGSRLAFGVVVAGSAAGVVGPARRGRPGSSLADAGAGHADPHRSDHVPGRGHLRFLVPDHYHPLRPVGGASPVRRVHAPSLPSDGHGVTAGRGGREPFLSVDAANGILGRGCSGSASRFFWRRLDGAQQGRPWRRARHGNPPAGRPSHRRQDVFHVKHDRAAVAPALSDEGECFT